MNLKLSEHQGSNYKSNLVPDLTNLSGPLEVDVSEVTFFRPEPLTLLYALFSYHFFLYPKEKRGCIPPPKDSDVFRYMQRMNFFKSCPDFEELQKEDFTRHPSAGTFIPIVRLKTEQEADENIKEIISMIFAGKTNEPGVKEVKYSFSELVGNSIEHSNSPIGCLMQAQLYKDRWLYGVILDTGIGIRKHLLGNQKIASLIKSDDDAIEFALRPGISGTHNRSGDAERTEIEAGTHHAGLGLTVVSKLVTSSGGYMHLISGKAGRFINRNGVSTDKIGGWPGTAIFFNIDCQNIPNVMQIIRDVGGNKPDTDDLGLKIEF